MFKNIINILIFIALISYLSGCAQVDKSDNLASQEIISKLSNIPLEAYKNAAYYIDDSIIKDTAFILAQSDDKDITIYGYESLDYGKRGIIADYKLNEKSNYTYFDFGWEAYYRKPEIFVADYDKDGKDEISLCIQESRGTGLSREQLIIFEILDTGNLEAYKFEYNNQLDEITDLIEPKIDKSIIHLVTKAKPEKNIMDISFKQLADNIEVEGLDYSSLVSFNNYDDLIMTVIPGLKVKTQASAYYDDSLNESLNFKVIYSKNKFKLELN